MVDQTDRLALDTYAQGEDNWDHTDTVELFDELAIDKGPLADRPASGNYDDQFFYATDQRTLWRWDAGTSDWNAAAGLGANGDPIPGTSYFENVDAGSVNTERLNTDYLYADAFDGADADARLDAVIADSSNGDRIYLEKDTYTDNRTINKELIIIGVNQFGANTGTDLEGTLTLNEQVTIENCIIGSDIDFQTPSCSLLDCRLEVDVTTDENVTKLIGCDGLGDNSFTFQSGSKLGVATGNTRISITDNGSNTIGSNSS